MEPSIIHATHPPATTPKSLRTRYRQLLKRRLRESGEYDRIWCRQNGLCPYCQRSLREPRGLHEDHEATVDHREPLARVIARGGNPLDPSNIAICCRRCNLDKGDKTASQWWAFRHRLQQAPRGMIA
jgi:5-methylcytosine-specific restriction endonuclease McrA